MLKGGTSSSYTVSAVFFIGAEALSRASNLLWTDSIFFSRKVALVSDFVLDSNGLEQEKRKNLIGRDG